MRFHLAPQTATGRTSPIDQMWDHQLSRLLGRQRRHGEHRLQQLSHVGRRERWQDCDFPWAGQVGITRRGLPPRPLGLGDQPHRPSRQGHMMLPGPILLGLACVPAHLGLRIFTGALGAGALAASRHHGWRWGGRWGLAQRRRPVALGVASDHQPCYPWPRAFGDRPDWPEGTIGFQPPACRLPHVARVPRGGGTAGQGAHLLRWRRAAPLQPRAWSAPLAPLLRPRVSA